jgi:hypothetical protein
MDKTAHTQSTGSGFCREHNFGMPVQCSNTHRLCSEADVAGTESASEAVSTNSSIQQQCADTPALSVGGGHGHTLGFMYPLLRPFLVAGSGGARLALAPSLAAPLHDILGLFARYNDSLELLPDVVAEPLGDIVHEHCDLQLDTSRDVLPGCYTNGDCGKFHVCSARGECRPLHFEFDNTHGKHAYEMGITGRNLSVAAGDDSIAGASPWQKVAGFMQHYGFCSHKNAITYERLQDVYLQLSSCETKHANGISWFECVRNSTVWDWVNHAPAVLFDQNNKLSQELTREYSSDMEEEEAASIDTLAGKHQYQYPFLRLQPHLCDMEYHHSQTLGFGVLERDGPAGSTSKWMRMSRLYSTASFLRTEKHSTNLDCRVYDASSCKAGDKLRFMGLPYDSIFYIQDQQTQAIVTDGKTCQLCEIEDFFIAGTRLLRLKYSSSANATLKDFVESEMCGSFGNLHTDGASCVLDPITVVLPLLLSDSSNQFCRKMLKAPAAGTGGELQCDTGHMPATCTYSPASVNIVQSYLNGLTMLKDFYVLPHSSGHDRRFLFEECMAEIVAYKQALMPTIMQQYSTPRVQFPPQERKKIANVRAYNVASGLYIFNLFNTYEVPLLWWRKYGEGMFVFRSERTKMLTTPRLSDWGSESVDQVSNRLFAWERRFMPSALDETDDIDGYALTKVIDAASPANVWSALNTEQLVPVRQNVKDLVISALSANVVSGISTDDHAGLVRYGFGTAETLSFADTRVFDKDMPFLTCEQEQPLSETCKSERVRQIQFFKSLSQKVYDVQTNQTVTMKQVEAMIDSRDQGEFTGDLATSTRQYFESRMVTATFVPVKKWMYYGQTAPRQYRNVLDLYATGAIDLSLATTSSPQAGALVDTAKCLFADGEPCITVHRECYYEQVVGATTHYYVPFSEDVDGPFNAREVSFDELTLVTEMLIQVLNRKQDNFEFFDPFAESAGNWSVFGSEMYDESVVDTYLKRDKLLPLAFFKIERDDVSNIENKVMLNKILQDFDANHNCHENKQLDIELGEAHAADAHKSCIWNPLYMDTRFDEVQYSKKNIANSSEITLQTKNKKTFAWDLCRPDMDGQHLNGYSTFTAGSGQQQNVADGPSCSFSDLNMAYPAAVETDGCKKPSLACDYYDRGGAEWSSRGGYRDQERIRWSTEDFDWLKKDKDTMCKPDQAADPAYTKRGSVTRNVGGSDGALGTGMPSMYAGEMYPNTRTDMRRSRTKKCMRIDSGCVAGNAQSLSSAPYHDLFHYTDLGQWTNPVDARYDQLERNAWSQVNLRDLEIWCKNHGDPILQEKRDPAFDIFTDSKLQRLFGRDGRQLDFDDKSIDEKCQMIRNNFGLGSTNSRWRYDFADIKLSYPFEPLDGSEGEDERLRAHHTSSIRNGTQALQGRTQGLKCNVKQVTVPKGVKVKLFALNSDLIKHDVDASFSHVTMADRVLFRKSAKNQARSIDQEQLLFGHHFYEDAAENRHYMPHSMPNPVDSFCPSDVDQFKTNYGKLHHFKVVDTASKKTALHMKTPWYFWDWNFDVDANLKTEMPGVKDLSNINRDCYPNCDEDRGMCSFCGPSGACCHKYKDDGKDVCGTHGFESKSTCVVPVDIPSMGKNYRREWENHIADTELLLRMKETFTPNFQGGSYNSSGSFLASDLCTVPKRSDDSNADQDKWTVWDLASCYENNPYEDYSWYQWTSVTTCSALMNFMDGTLSYLWFEALSSPGARMWFFISQIFIGNMRVTLFDRETTTHTHERQTCERFKTHHLLDDLDCREVEKSTPSWESLHAKATNWMKAYHTKQSGFIKSIDGKNPQEDSWTQGYSGEFYEGGLRHSNPSENGKWSDKLYIPMLTSVQHANSDLLSRQFFKDSEIKKMSYKYDKGKNWFFKPAAYPMFSLRLKEPDMEYNTSIIDVNTTNLQYFDHVVESCYGRCEMNPTSGERSVKQHLYTNFVPAKNFMFLDRSGKYDRIDSTLFELRGNDIYEYYHEVPRSVYEFNPLVAHYWADLISTRNQLQADKVCACEDIVPNLKAQIYADKNYNNAKFFQPDDHEIWMSPNHFRHPHPIEEHLCTDYCTQYGMSHGTGNNKRARFMSKVLHQHLHRPSDQQNNNMQPSIASYLAQSDDTLPLTLSSCIVDRPHDLYDMQLNQYKSFAWKDNKIQDTVPGPEVAGWMVAAKTFLDTFLTGATGAETRRLRQQNVCYGGGSTRHLVTKPSRWAEVDARPVKYLVPCKASDADADCKPILREIVDVDSSVNEDMYYVATVNEEDNTVTYSVRYKHGGQSATSMEYICSYELELDGHAPAQETTECYHECDDLDPLRPCNKYLQENADACHHGAIASSPHSHLPVSKACTSAAATYSECHGLSQCLPCEDFVPEQELQFSARGQGASALIDSTCAGSGLYALDTFSGAKHAAHDTTDSAALSVYIGVLEDKIQDILFHQDADRRKQSHADLQANIERQLREASFTMVEKLSVDNVDAQQLQALRVKVDCQAAGDTPCQHVSLKLFVDMTDQTLYSADRKGVSEQEVDALTYWGEMGVAEPLRGESRDEAALKSANAMWDDEWQAFPRFDIFDALLDDEFIQTDFSAGCVLDASNLESSIEARQCKDSVANKTIAVLRDMVRELYTEIHGLPLQQVLPGETMRVRVNEDAMDAFSWYEGLLPWYARSDREQHKSMDQRPFLNYLLSDETCEREFARTSTANMPCFRDVNNSAETVVPFVAHNYAWPKPGFSSVTEKGRKCSFTNNGLEAAQINNEVCVRELEERLRVLSRQMIGSDLCTFFDGGADERTPSSFLRACFASFCTDKSHVGRPDPDLLQCINTTHVDEPCVNPDECKCFASNKFHENKTICKWSSDLNTYVAAELPSIKDMKVVRRLYAENELFHFRPDFSRCGVTFKDAQTQFSPPGRTAVCLHEQSLLGYSMRESQTFLASRVAPTLDRTHIIPENTLHVDVLSVHDMWQSRRKTLWAGDRARAVLGEDMAYPAGAGTKLYPLLALAPTEVGPDTVELAITPHSKAFGVQNVRLLRGGAPDADWVKQIPASVARGLLDLNASDVYRRTEALLGSAGRYDWVCQYMRTALVSGSRPAFERYTQIRLKTPNPGRMRARYAQLQGLHPWAVLRDVHVPTEVKRFRHFGLLLLFDDASAGSADAMQEMRLFLDNKAVRHAPIMGQTAGQVALDWPHLNYTLRSGERLLSDGAQPPHDLLPLYRPFSITIEHRRDAGHSPAVQQMLGRHHPYEALRGAYAESRSSLDQGGVCHKSPLTRVPNATLHAMLDFDVCYMEWEAHDASARRYQCYRSGRDTAQPSAQNFTLNTTLHSNYEQSTQLRRYQTYHSCSAVPPSPPATAYAGGHKHALRMHEISIGARMRISPVWRRMLALKARNLTTEVPDPSTWWGRNVYAPVANASLATDDPFATNWLFQCPPNTPASGSFPKSAWLYSTRRSEQCSSAFFDGQVQDRDCEIAREVDMCKVPGLEELCSVISTNVNRIRRANMQRAGLVSGGVELYTPSSFWNVDARYAWEIVARTYQQMSLIESDEAVAACANVAIASKITEDLVVSRSDVNCLSTRVVWTIQLLEQVRKQTLALIDIVMYLGDGLFNAVMGFMSLFIPDRNLSERFSSSFFQIAIDHFLSAFTHMKKLIETTVKIVWNMLMKDYIVQYYVDLAWALCQGFKHFVLLIVDTILDLLTGLCSVIASLPFSNDCGFVATWVTDMQEARRDVESWTCRIQTAPLCSQDKECSDVGRLRFADVCYRDLVGGSDALGGDLYVAEVSGAGGGSFSCNSASFCLQGLGDVVFCGDCSTSLISDFHCGSDNRCRCGSELFRTSACAKNADCGPEESCQISYGFQTAGATMPCRAQGRDRVMCMRDSLSNTVGACTVVKNFEDTENTPCETVGTDPEPRDVRGVCLHTLDDNTRHSEVEFSALFGFRCELLFGAEATLLVPFCADVITAAPFLRRESLKIYAPLLSLGGRRLLSTDARAPPADPHPSMGDLARFAQTLGPRLRNAPMLCAAALAPNSTGPESDGRTCARWLLFWNQTMQDTELMDVQIFELRRLAEYVVRKPESMMQMAARAPAALLLVLDTVVPLSWTASKLAQRTGSTPAGLGDALATASSAGAQIWQFGSLLRTKDAALKTPLEHPPVLQPRANDYQLVDVHRHAPFHVVHGHRVRSAHVLSRRAHPAGHGRRLLVADESTLATELSEYNDASHNAEEREKVKVWLKGFEPDAHYALKRVQAPRCRFVTESVFIELLLGNMQRSLARYGWQKIPPCDTSAADLWNVYMEQPCPPVDIVVETLVNNTLVLSEYYSRLSASGCLSNENVSCLPPARNSYTTAFAAFPRAHVSDVDPLNATRPSQNTDEEFIEVFVRTMRDVIALFNFADASQQRVFWGIFNFEATYDTEKYEQQTARNEFSLGRITRDFLVCDLQESLECSTVRSPLVPVFFAMLMLIVIVVTLVPLPSPLTFFLWTLGLSYGTVYLAYNFSPLCFPRIPICLFDGLYEVVLFFFPASVSMPSNLLPGGQGSCSDYYVGSTLTATAALETFLRDAPAKFTRAAAEQCYEAVELATCKHAFEAVPKIYDFVQGDKVSNNAVFYCMLFNLYRIVAVVCLALFLVPTALYTLASVLVVGFSALKLSFTISTPEAVVDMDGEESDVEAESADAAVDLQAVDGPAEANAGQVFFYQL